VVVVPAGAMRSIVERPACRGRVGLREDARMTWQRVLGLGFAGAFLGMFAGGAFGAAAGVLVPDLFSTLVPGQPLPAVPTATVCGAAVGVVLGGCLICFAIVVELWSATIGRLQGRTGGVPDQPSPGSADTMDQFLKERTGS
jgi:hypothetical protein